MQEKKVNDDQCLWCRSRTPWWHADHDCPGTYQGKERWGAVKRWRRRLQERAEAARKTTIPPRLKLEDVLDSLTAEGKAEVMLWADKQQREEDRRRMEEWWDKEQQQIIDNALARWRENYD